MPRRARNIRSILLVEDNPDHADLIRVRLKRSPLREAFVDHASRLSEAVMRFKTGSYDVALVDLTLPDSGLQETLPRVMEVAGDTPVVVLTSMDDVDFAMRTLEQGVQDYLVKSELNEDNLFRSVHYAVRRNEISCELVRTAEELKRCASTIAHEVRTPLHVVSCCLQVIERKYDDQLDEKTGEMIEESRKAIFRVADLAQRLMEFATVGGHGSEKDPVDLGKVFGDALYTVQSAHPESGLEAEVGEMPTLPGDEILLRQLFVNLLSNAVKYCDEAPPRVSMTATKGDGEWEFSVSDNGIGIAPGDEDLIFDVFVRGSAGRDRQGSGIGLALCRRVVEYHGGRIWVEPADKDGDGARVRFTLAES